MNQMKGGTPRQKEKGGAGKTQVETITGAEKTQQRQEVKLTERHRIKDME